MIGKKINQLATELAPVSTDLTIIGDPISGVSKKITLAQLGAIFSGAVSFYTNLAAFPAVGDINVIYCAKDTQKLYLWSGSAYTEVFPSQALLNTYQLRSEKGVSNGYASLDSGGKVPISQLPSSIMEYKGTWNAATNTPTLANGTGDTGDVYICNVAGTVNFGAGPLTFAVGDYVIYGTIWQRSSGAVGTVTSVGVTRSGDALAITGSPITTSGTINLGFAGTSLQYINGAGNLVTFPGIISQAQNLVTEVYNKTGATLTKGTVVYISGGQGNLPSVTKALATGDSTSAQTYGIVQNDITNNNNGFVVAAGRLSDLDTQAFTEGTQLYLSPTTAGTYQSTKPYAPQHLVYVAIVVRAHPTQGVIEVKIQNGYEMDELHNVAAQNPDNNDLLQYKTATSLWTKVAGTTTNIAEGTNLYYTDTRARAAITLTTTGTSGAATYSGGTLNIPQYQAVLTNPVTGTGASGQVTYFNGTSTVTGTNNHFWDATNNRLGIGTTTPQRSIEIFNATADNHLRLSGAAPSVSMGEAVTGSIYQAKFGLVTTNGQFASAGVAGDFVIISQTGATIFVTNSTEKMRVQASGNMSVGNTNNTYRLDVTGTGRFTGQLRLESTITDGTNTYTLPSATGTLALTSALSGYLPLTGGTLTGALGGTSATFTTNFNGSTWVKVSNSDTGSGAAAGFLMANANGDLGAISLTSTANSPSNALFIRTLSTNSLVLGANSGQHLTIASTGSATFSSSVTATSVGINTTNLDQKLVINQGVSGLNQGIPATSGTTQNGMLRLRPGVGVFGETLDFGMNVGPTYAWIQATNSSGLNTNYSLALNPNGGNVGINTSSPSSLLHVGSAVSGTPSTSPTAIQLDNTYATGGDGFNKLKLYLFRDPASQSYGFSVGDLSDLQYWAGSSSSGVHRFFTSQTERMRITSGGNVLVGTTANDFGSRQVNNSATSYTFHSVRTGTGSEGHLVFSNANGAVGSIFTNASVTSYNVTSDYRLKQDFKDYSGLDLVNKIKTYDYAWKIDGQRMYGVIAHELQLVINYAVTGVKDGKEMQQVDYSKIVPVLIKAIQEQQLQIDTLKNK